MQTTTLSRWVLAGMIAVALMMRAPITGVPPALLPIAESLSLNATAAGLVTTLPLICFGVFAFLSPFLSARFGVEPTLWVPVVLLLIGIGVRLIVGVTPFYTGTLLIGLGVAIANVIVPALARTWFAPRLAAIMGLYSVMLQISGSAGPFVTSPNSLGQLARRPMAWLITFVMGVQSLLFFTLVTWLPTQFRLVELSTAQAG